MDLNDLILLVIGIPIGIAVNLVSPGIGRFLKAAGGPRSRWNEWFDERRRHQADVVKGLKEEGRSFPTDLQVARNRRVELVRKIALHATLLSATPTTLSAIGVWFYVFAPLVAYADDTQARFGLAASVAEYHRAVEIQFFVAWIVPVTVSVCLFCVLLPRLINELRTYWVLAPFFRHLPLQQPSTSSWLSERIHGSPPKLLSLPKNESQDTNPEERDSI